MIKLTPDQQKALIDGHPDAFTPENGAWGRSGCTRVILKVADAEAVGEALTLAWRNISFPMRARRRHAAR